MKLIDAFFAPPKEPAIGNAKDQCVARAAIRNSQGNIVRWHALLTEEQWAYHSSRGAKGFVTDAASAGKGGFPSHYFAGRPVVDEAAKKIYEPGKPARDIVDMATLAQKDPT
jgi:hypothetical protein